MKNSDRNKLGILLLKTLLLNGWVVVAGSANSGVINKCKKGTFYRLTLEKNENKRQLYFERLYHLQAKQIERIILN